MVVLDEIILSLLEQQSKAEAELEKINKSIEAVGDLKSEQIARGISHNLEPEIPQEEIGQS